MEKKEWLFSQLKGLIELNKDTNDLIASLQKSLLPDKDQWIQDAYKHIEQNNWLIGLIKRQLLRDHDSELSEEELEILDSIK